MKLTRKDKLLYYQLLALALLALAIAVWWFGFTSPGIDAAPAPTATPAIVVTPTPNTDQASIFWGETLYLLCYEDAQAREQNQPNGILTFDVTGSDNVRITCRAPGTEGVGVDVRLKDGGE